MREVDWLRKGWGWGSCSGNQLPREKLLLVVITFLKPTDVLEKKKKKTKQSKRQTQTKPQKPMGLRAAVLHVQGWILSTARGTKPDIFKVDVVVHAC